MYNRYNILKIFHKEYVILIKKNNKYYSFNYDKRLFNYFNNNINNLNKYYINYIILDNKEIMERKEYINNKYKEYMYKIFIINIVKSYEKESNNRCINFNNN